MDKHAYLIMAYRQFDVLEKILCILDDERNDFYIHIDKKAADFDPEVIKGASKIRDSLFAEKEYFVGGL